MIVAVPATGAASITTVAIARTSNEYSRSDGVGIDLEVVYVTYFGFCFFCPSR
ncbi:hypothetical protein LCGC14_1317270 [marine sediment metagenome]|uniref:Uncharacterized protein n=1 Tax=marine sediment metagenome TaxID=412755 RepID=A0A0F9L5V9_9ZZZZ